MHDSRDRVQVPRLSTGRSAERRAGGFVERCEKAALLPRCLRTTEPRSTRSGAFRKHDRPLGHVDHCSIRSLNAEYDLWKLWTLRRTRESLRSVPTLASELIARAAAIGAGKPRCDGDQRSFRRTCAPRSLPARCGRGASPTAGVRELRSTFSATRSSRSRSSTDSSRVRRAPRSLPRPTSSGCRRRLRRSRSSGVRSPARSSRSFRRPSPRSSRSCCSSSSHPPRPRSLWILDAAGATTCLVSHGKAPRSRRLREVAKAALDGVTAGSPQVHVRVVERWDRPHAALVARGRVAESEHLEEYLEEAANALAPLLERASLFDRRVQREHDLVAAGERRLLRLGFDLHDGPLQEIVALADEMRTASTQISAVVPDDYRQRVRGRFNDVHARLGALDESLRQIAHSIRSTTAVARPVADAVEAELSRSRARPASRGNSQVEGDLASSATPRRSSCSASSRKRCRTCASTARPSKVSIVLRSKRTFVDLTVTDDGCGFDPRGLDTDRLGLAGISERVRLLGGAVEIKTDSRRRHDGPRDPCRSGSRRHLPPLRSTPLHREPPGHHRFSSPCRGWICRGGRAAHAGAGHQHRRSDHRHHHGHDGHHDDADDDHDAEAEDPGCQELSGGGPGARALGPGSRCREPARARDPGHAPVPVRFSPAGDVRGADSRPAPTACPGTTSASRCARTARSAGSRPRPCH